MFSLLRVLVSSLIAIGAETRERRARDPAPLLQGSPKASSVEESWDPSNLIVILRTALRFLSPLFGECVRVTSAESSYSRSESEIGGNQTTDRNKRGRHTEHRTSQAGRKEISVSPLWPSLDPSRGPPAWQSLAIPTPLFKMSSQEEEGGDSGERVEREENPLVVRPY